MVQPEYQRNVCHVVICNQQTLGAVRAMICMRLEMGATLRAPPKWSMEKDEESGIQSKIYDIWGANGEGEFILCGADNQLGQITNTATAKVRFVTKYLFGFCLVEIKGFKIYISENGIFENNDGKEWKPIAKYIDRAVSKIRGNNCNDVFGFGTFGFISHSNGVCWTRYTGTEHGFIFIWFYQ
ncbi:MAG: hypothetical protein MZV64_61435 [Ignavibacteriales bacterium]|nr:hypothetical protein [Ignavibacteriales bacterium]